MRLRAGRIYGLAAGILAAVLSLSAVEADRLKAHVTWLSAPELAGRRAGRPGAVQAAQYISDQFREAGFTVQMQEFSGNRRNVVARYGAAERYIVIGAHYDGQPGLPSASDNAAGVAVLLELARDLKTADLPVSIVMIAFDDEESGLNGSRYYVDNPIYPLNQTLAAVILDSMGRSFIDLKEMTLFALGTEYSAALETITARHKREGILIAGTDLIGPRSDFAPFAVMRVPYLFFSHATHKDYHGAGDSPELLNYSKLAEDAGLIGKVIRDIAELKTPPVFRDEPVYPPGEIETLLRILAMIKDEKKDMAPAYTLVFDDMSERLKTDSSRTTLSVAASAMLGLATPNLSPFLLELIVAPFYEKAGKPEIVKALGEESSRLQR